MSDEDNKGSAEAGSPNNFGNADPGNAGESVDAGENKGNEGKGGDAGDGTNWETQYKELEKKFGEQGEEVGKWRTYFQGVNPLLTKLENQDELIRAIMDDKVDSKLAEAVLEGKVTLKDASDVQKAHDDVQKKMGKEKYDKASAGEISELIKAQVDKGIGEAKVDFDKKLTEAKEDQEYKEKLNSFISNTPDYQEYVVGITKWFQDHPNQVDMEVAYHAVKGEALGRKAEEDKIKAGAEASKDLAANASGGSSQQTGLKKEAGVDDLIGSSQNPNSF